MAIERDAGLGADRQGGPPGGASSGARRDQPDWISALLLVALLVVPMFVGAVLQAAGPPVFWLTYAYGLLALPVAFWKLRPRPAVVVTAMVVWFAGHKLLVALATPTVGAQIAVWLQSYKEAAYLVLLAVGLVSAVVAARGLDLRATIRAASAADLLGAAFIALVAVYFLLVVIIAPDDLQSELIYARRFASLPIIFFAGRLLWPDAPGLRRSIAYLVAVSAVVAAFGLVERLVLGDRFWIDIVHIASFQGSTIDQGFGSSHARLVDGLPANWISFLGDVTIRRLVASFLEPTTLAIFLALGISFGAFLVPEWRRDHRWAWLAVMLIVALALVLTQGKGGMLAAGVIVFVVLVRTSRRSAWAVAVVVGVAVLVALWVGQYLPVGVNLTRHVSGLLTGLGHVLEQPLGSGLGSTGFWGEQVKIGTDSTLGAIASQLGIAGGVLYLGWLAATAWQLLPIDASMDISSLIRRAIAGAVIALLVVGVVSNSASGLLAGAFYALFAGWIMTTVPDQAGPGSAQ